MGVSELTQGAMAAISEQFPEAAVVGEASEQPAEGDSFLVTVAGGSQERLLNRSHRRTYRLVVRYNGTTNAARNEAADRLYDALRTIAVPDAVWKAAAMSHETIESVLHFTVQYPVRVIEEQPAGIRMQTLNQEGVIG